MDLHRNENTPRMFKYTPRVKHTYRLQVLKTEEASLVLCRRLWLTAENKPEDSGRVYILVGKSYYFGLHQLVPGDEPPDGQT